MRRDRHFSSTIAECELSIPETTTKTTTTTTIATTTRTRTRTRSIRILIVSLLLVVVVGGAVKADSSYYPRRQQQQQQQQKEEDIFLEITPSTIYQTMNNNENNNENNNDITTTTSLPPTTTSPTICTEGGQDPWNTPTGIERPCCPTFISCLAPWSTTTTDTTNTNTNTNTNTSPTPRWHYLCVLPLDCPTLQVTPTPSMIILETEEPQISLPALPPSEPIPPLSPTGTPTTVEDEEPQVSLPALPPSFEFVLYTSSPTITPTITSTTNHPTVRTTLSPTKAPTVVTTTTSPTLSPVITTTTTSPTKLPTLVPTKSPVVTTTTTTSPTKLPTLAPIQEVSLPVLPPSEPTLSPTISMIPPVPPPKKSSPSPTTLSPTTASPTTTPTTRITPVPSEASSMPTIRRSTILPTVCRKAWCRPSSSTSSPTITPTITTTQDDIISPSPSLFPTTMDTVPPTSSSTDNDNTSSSQEEDNDTDTDTTSTTTTPLQRLTLSNVQLDLRGGQIMNLNTQVHWQLVTAQQILAEVQNVNGNNPNIVWDTRVAITVLLQTSIGSDISFMVVEPLPRSFMEDSKDDDDSEDSEDSYDDDTDSDDDSDNDSEDNRQRQLLNAPVQRQLEDGGGNNILRINFDVMIAFKSILTDHNVERYVLGAFNTYQDQDNYRTALQDTGNPSFQDITTIAASLPTGSMDTNNGGNGDGNNGIDGALGEKDNTSSNGRLGGITRIQGKTAVVGGILIGICVLALMGVLYVVKTKYYTQRQRRHQRLDHPYFGSDYTPRTPHTPPSPPTNEHDRRRRRRRESSTTSSLFTSLPVWNIFRKKKQQQHHQQQQEPPYDGTWNAAIHPNHFSSVEINIEAHGEQSDVSTLHDPIPPGEDQLSLEEDNTAVFSYDYQQAHGINVIGTEDSSSEGGSPRPLILGGIPTITPDPDSTSSPHNNNNNNNDHDGGASGATSPLMATTIPASSISSTPKSDTPTTLDDDPYNVTEDPIEINAPSGKLGLILETAPNNGVPTVTKIKHGSPLAYQVKVDDKLLSVDGLDVTVMKGREVSKLIASKQDNYVRRFIFARPRTKKHLDTVLL